MVVRHGVVKIVADLPESGFCITGDTSGGAVDATLLCEWSRRAAFLTLLLWHLLLLRLLHTLGWRPLWDTVAVVLLGELSLLIGIVLVGHRDCLPKSRTRNEVRRVTRDCFKAEMGQSLDRPNVRRSEAGRRL